MASATSYSCRTAGLACAIAPKCVLVAVQPLGGLASPGKTEFQQSANTRIPEVPNCGLVATRPEPAAHANRPNQPVPGNRYPAAVSGDAQPMIPSGGTTDAARAAMTRSRMWRHSEDQNAAQGIARSAAAITHSASAER